MTIYGFGMKNEIINPSRESLNFLLSL